MPQCKQCGETKSSAHFSIDRNRSSGLRTECRECASKNMREYRVALKRPRALGYTSFPGNSCVYCGVPAQCYDHVPALNNVAILPNAARWLYPACLDCNSRLRDYIGTDVNERKDEVTASLRRKFGGIIDTPEWSDEEIRELGRSLRGMVKSHRHLQDHLRERLGVLSVRV